ncbi:MAG: zinc-dependent alcohol dehydrogenase [Chloroflexota bacterium]|jgi:2-desacetyl-2-hydroxyethyl bacteriochlorophyllide A dehydrogenase
MSDTHAVWTVAPYQVRIQTESLAPLNADEVAISTHYSAISHGTEMLVYRGQVPSSMALDLPTLEGSFAFPIKYGYAVVGRVQDIGDAVADVAIGDMVFALHPHQTYCHVHHTLVKKIPPTVPAKAAVLAANMETAINIVHDTRPVLGDIVVVIGLGVVGLLVSWLLARQAVRVIAIDPIAHRRECAQQMGVLKVIHPDEAPQFVHMITEKRGADCVIEVSGNPEALPLALDLVGQEGLIVVASWYGSKPVTLDLGSRFHRGRVRMRSSQVGQLAPDLAPRWDYQRRMSVVWRMLAQFPYHVVLTHEYRFENAASAYDVIDRNELPMVQTVLQYAIDKG